MPLTEYLLVAGVVLAVNLLPAFGPPTWAVLVFLRFQLGLPAAPLIALGAIAAAVGRFLLASASRHARGRLSARRLDNLDATEKLLVGSRRRALAGLALFAVSPVPSAQLFVAAGLLKVPLVPLTAAFFAGRLVSYSLYVAAASAARQSLRAIVERSLTSPVSVALQVAMLAVVVALVRVDWLEILARRRHDPGPGGSP